MYTGEGAGGCVSVPRLAKRTTDWQMIGIRISLIKRDGTRSVQGGFRSGKDRRSVQQQADQPADQGAVEADELQVTATLSSSCSTRCRSPFTVCAICVVTPSRRRQSRAFHQMLVRCLAQLGRPAGWHRANPGCAAGGRPAPNPRCRSARRLAWMRAHYSCRAGWSIMSCLSCSMRSASAGSSRRRCT